MEAFDGFEGTVNIGGRSITNLRFTDDVDLVEGKAEELINLIRRLEESAKRFHMQISAQKTVMMMGTNEDVAVTITVKIRKFLHR